MTFRTISSSLAGLALCFSALAADNTVKLVQERLARLGFYSGPINGDLSGDAQAALTQFQISQLLPASGGLDDETLRALGVQRPREPSAAADAAPQSSQPLPDDSPAAITVKLAQEQLHIRGFYTGLIDGDLSGDSQAALTQFQLSQNIPASGTLDEETLKALGIQRQQDQSAAAGGSALVGASPEQKAD